jgi:hypothetical protein
VSESELQRDPLRERVSGPIRREKQCFRRDPAGILWRKGFRREREREREISRRDPAENPSREGRPAGERERFDGEIRQRFRRERDYPARRRERRGGFFVLTRTLTPSNAGEDERPDGEERDALGGKMLPWEEEGVPERERESE